MAKMTKRERRGALILLGLFAILFVVFFFTSDKPTGPSRSISESVSDWFGGNR